MERFPPPPSPPAPAPPKPKRSPFIYQRRQQPQPNLFIYDPLPTAPPDLCTDGNIFKFPPVIRNSQNVCAESSHRLHSPLVDDDLTDGPSVFVELPNDKNHCCAFCRPYREDRETIEPLKSRLKSAIEAMDQLNNSYALLDKLLEQKLATIEDSDDQDQEKDEQNASSSTATYKATTRDAIQQANDTQSELEHSLTFLESIFGTEIVPIFKQGAFKRMRERSKSMMEDEIHILNKERTVKSGSTTSMRPHLLRRQSTYSENKSKVSKWTKVKAAFKWERANVPPANASEGMGLTPVNHEVARYLKVPTNPCGGSSSADSVVSFSSSGHFMSDTPGTISSASSIDDIEASCRHAIRRDSSKSDTRCDSRTSVDLEIAGCELSKSATDECSKQTTPSKSASNKSIRRSKVFSDFEVLPEDHVADIKSTSNRRNKLPPSPLNLNREYNDFSNLHSPQSLKSPNDGFSSLNRTKRISSPGNSSVPSSPSRHSDFFPEFESEDISSGDFSEPTTPNRKTCLQGQDEVFRRYQRLLLELDKEFKAKEKKYELSVGSRGVVPGTVLRGSGKKSDEHSPTQVYNSDLVTTELLEENLTPEFKKKLHKWRIKKQNSLMCVPYHQSHQHQQTQQTGDSSTSPSGKNIHSAESTKPKFDWNLWSTGQVKLEGQGLCALPDQKDLPEKFQKRMEEWYKIKGTGAVSDNDSLKRTSKHSQSTRRGSDDDRWYKHKPHDREKLAKLKAIVAPDHQTKNIEVQTASGVMKFEGISRKFTRKLYEWEKARGIGPEASTFALLHPGYCPIDVRRINKESRNAGDDNSPTLSRSLSLDSMTPNVTSMPAITQQPSSLSLNNVNELKSTEESADALTDHEFKKDDELEAVMVEVEEHIDDTASPLVTAHTLVEQQTPIYKYEEVQCNDYCNTRRVQSFESHTNLAPLLSALKRADDLFDILRKASHDIVENTEMRSCQMVLLSIRSIYPYYSNNLMKPNVLNAISDVQNELGRLTELSKRSPLDEACCQEIMEERNHEYNEEFRGLLESLECLKTGIQGGLPKDIVPDINVTNEDGHESSIYVPCDNTHHLPSKTPLPTTLEANDELSGSHKENETESTATTTYRAPTNPSNNVSKKKLRLRKMGSRQNSKTESDSSDEETQSVLETPRRLRRQKFRLKQRSLDDDYRLRSEEQATALPSSSKTTSENVLYTLKVKPGQPIEQTQTISGGQQVTKPPEETAKVTAFVPPPLPEQHTLSYNTNANVFVKTKRKLFTTIVEPNATEGIAVIEKVLDSPTLNEAAVDEASPDVETACAIKLPEPQMTPAKHETPKIIMQKSISLDDITPSLSIEEDQMLRKAQSSEFSTKSLIRRFEVPPPLAADSFRIINKNLPATNKEPLVKAANNAARKEHLFKKNILLKSPTSTSAKIEHKIAKTNSASAVDCAPLTLPNRMDNTLPRIHRKLDGKTLTPTTAKHFEFPVETPNQIVVDVSDEKPVTPISERALKLQRAKAEFLQGSSGGTSASQTPTPTSPMVFSMPTPTVEVPNNDLWPNDVSDHCSNGNDDDTSALQKCNSVAAINVPLSGVGGGSVGGEASQQSDICTDHENSSIYENLPRSVTRSGKLSSKLGFATLASKLRRVKGGSKRSKESGSGSGTALSALCRQTLMADVIALPQMIATSGATGATASSGNVLKSQSSPHAATYRKTTSHEALNKSQSEQFVKYLVSKESDV